MNEELQSVIAEFVKTFLETGKEIKDFATVQIPDVIQQALMWYGIYNFILFVAAIAIAFIGAYLNVKFFRWLGKSNNEELVPFMAVTIALTVIPTGVLFNLDWLKIWIAPKLWLIEFASSLVANAGGK